MKIAPINVTLPTSDPDTVPLGICTRCGYPGPAGAKCINPRGCERVADPFAAFIGHARVEGARLALEAAERAVDNVEVIEQDGMDGRCDDGLATLRSAVNAIGRLDPAAIVKP